MGLKVRENEASERRRYVAIGNSALRLKKAEGGASFLVSVNYSIWDDKEDRLANELPKSTKQIEIPLSCVDLPRIYERLYAAIGTATNGLVEDDVPERSDATGVGSDAATTATADGEKTAGPNGPVEATTTEQDAGAQAAEGPADTETHAENTVADTNAGGAEGETGAQDTTAEPADGSAEGETTAQDTAAETADGGAEGETTAQDTAAEPAAKGAEGETGAQDTTADPADGGAEGETDAAEGTEAAREPPAPGAQGVAVVIIVPVEGATMGQDATVESGCTPAEAETTGLDAAVDAPAQGKTDERDSAPGPEGVAAVAVIRDEVSGDVSVVIAVPVRSAEAEPKEETAEREAAAHAPGEPVEGDTAGRDATVDGADGGAEVETDGPIGEERAGQDAAAEAADRGVGAGTDGQTPAAEAAEVARDASVEAVADVALISDGASVVIVVPVPSAEAASDGATEDPSGGGHASPLSARVHMGDPDEVPPMMHRMQVSVQSFPGPDGEPATQITVAAVPKVREEAGAAAPEVPEDAGSAGGPAPETGAGPEYAVMSDAEVRVKKRPDSVMYEVATTYGVWTTKESWLADGAAAREVPVKVSLPLWDLPRMFECLHVQMKTEHGGPVEER
jgi:hypothetical protein